MRDFETAHFPSAKLTIAVSSLDHIRCNQVVITGLVLRRSLYDCARKWHRLRSMTELRELRRAADLSQQEFAALMSVPVNTFRMWDSGLRPAPLDAVQRARLAVAEHARNTQFESLDQLACELGVHVRTLRAAARTGRLVVQFSSRSAFGRPIRFATRAAAAAFMERYYRQSYSRTARRPPSADTHVPSDFAKRLLQIRRALQLTQAQLAEEIGAAGKAVVYQWESRKRKPSPVFWKRIEALRGVSLGVRPRSDCVDGVRRAPDASVAAQ
jgi:DNA-binding transcriptional regulator YiaG